MNYDDTLVIFGCSPYINGIKRYIPAICKKWHTMGINEFCNTFKDVEYVIFNDRRCNPKFDKTHYVITNLSCTNYNTDLGKKLYSHAFKEYCYVVPSKNLQLDAGEHKLSIYHHTTTMAINWAYLHGFKNVVLIGVDLINNTGHFFDKDYMFSWDENRINESIKHLENINDKYINLYKVNAKNEINIPLIKIGDLINDN